MPCEFDKSLFNLHSTGPITESVPFLPLFLIWLLHDQAAFQGPCPLNYPFLRAKTPPKKINCA